MNRQFLFCQIGSHKNGKWFLKKWKNLQQWFPKKRKTLLYTIYIQNKTPLFAAQTNHLFFPLSDLLFKPIKTRKPLDFSRGFVISSRPDSNRRPTHYECASLHFRFFHNFSKPLIYKAFSVSIFSLLMYLFGTFRDFSPQTVPGQDPAAPLYSLLSDSMP